MGRSRSKKKRDKMKVDPSVHRGQWEVKPIHLTTPKKIEAEEKEARLSKQKGWSHE